MEFGRRFPAGFRRGGIRQGRGAGRQSWVATEGGWARSWVATEGDAGGWLIAVVGRVSGGRIFFLWWFEGGDNGGFRIFFYFNLYKSEFQKLKREEESEANL